MVDNPITFGDIERCPYTCHSGHPYDEWNRKDNERLEKIRRSWLRFLKRMFASGAWHPNYTRVNTRFGYRYIVNEDLFL